MWWTLAAALVGSATALIIATIIYPWQKKLDRDNVVLHERRTAYRNFIRASTGLRHAVQLQINPLSKSGKADFLEDKDFLHALLKYQQNVQELLVVCPEAVIETVVEHTTAVKELVLATRMGPAFEGFQPLLDNERGCYRAVVTRMSPDFSEQGEAYIRAILQSLSINKRA